MALWTKLYKQLFVYFAEAMGKKRIKNSRIKNIIVILNRMQYKKNKKIEATRPFLCGKKIAKWWIFFQSGIKNIILNF
jgi:hypothetical protein